MELNPHISATDKEMKDYFPKLLEISYEVMIRHFNTESADLAMPDWLKPREEMAEIYLSLLENETEESGFIDKIFGHDSKIENDKFIEKMNGDFAYYL